MYKKAPTIKSGIKNHSYGLCVSTELIDKFKQFKELYMNKKEIYNEDDSIEVKKQKEADYYWKKQNGIKKTRKHNTHLKPKKKKRK